MRGSGAVESVFISNKIEIRRENLLERLKRHRGRCNRLWATALIGIVTEEDEMRISLVSGKDRVVDYSIYVTPLVLDDCKLCSLSRA